MPHSELRSLLLSFADAAPRRAAVCTSQRRPKSLQLHVWHATHPAITFAVELAQLHAAYGHSILQTVLL